MLTKTSSKVEEELTEREDGNKSSSRGTVGDTSPYGIEDADDDTGPELVAYTTNDVGDEDGDVESASVVRTARRLMEGTVFWNP